MSLVMCLARRLLVSRTLSSGFDVRAVGLIRTNVLVVYSLPVGQPTGEYILAITCILHAEQTTYSRI